jgi:hypothetical protein
MEKKERKIWVITGGHRINDGMLIINRLTPIITFLSFCYFGIAGPH